MTRVKRQHYVPQFLLRHFCANNSNRLWVFDKQTEKSWKQSIREVGHQKYFNEAQVDSDLVVSFDEKFQFIENEAAPVIAKLNQGLQIESLAEMELGILCYFMAIQYMRTPAFLTDYKQFVQSVDRELKCSGSSSELAKQFGSVSQFELKRESLEMVFKLAEQIANALVPKTWIVHRPIRNQSFLVSDAPVVLHNSTRDPRGGNIGFEVPGIAVIMPISATHLVGAYCPGIFRGAENTGRQQTVRTGGTIALVESDMEFYNSLQVACSERFIYSRDDDFALAERILRANPSLKKPVRVQVHGPSRAS